MNSQPEKAPTETPTIAPTKPSPTTDPSKVNIPKPSVEPGPKAFYYFFPESCPWIVKK